MKDLSVIFLSVFFSVNGYSQNDRYEFYAGQKTLVYQEGKTTLLPQASYITNEKLCSAKFMSDIIPDYPTSYYNSIIDYTFVQITIIDEGKKVFTNSMSDTLTKEQLSVLDNAGVNSAIYIKVHFKYKDALNDGMGSLRKTKEMDFKVNVIPAVEAEYDGGYDKMTSYLREKVLTKVPVTSTNAKVPEVSVLFTVNENGYVSDAKMLKESADPNFDKLFLEAVNNMPKWKPAENAKGVKVKQQFTIGVPTVRRGC